MTRGALIAVFALALGAGLWFFLDGPGLSEQLGSTAREDGASLTGESLRVDASGPTGGPTLQGAPSFEGDAGGGRLPGTGRSDGAGGSTPAAEASLSTEMRGLVLDAAGRPASGVTVLMLGLTGADMSRTFETDGEGRFTGTLPLGRYVLYLSSSGQGLIVDGFLLDGGSGTSAEFTLEALVEIRVEATRAGAGLAGVALSLRQNPTPNRMRVSSPQVTDSDGIARLSVVARAEYWLEAITPEGLRGTRRVVVDSASVIRWEFPETTILTGNVRDAATGLPVGGATISVHTRDGTGASVDALGESSADGTFEMDVPRVAPHGVGAGAFDYAPWPVATAQGEVVKSLRPLARGEVVHLDVPLSHGASIRGRATQDTAAGPPVPGVSVRFVDGRGNAAGARSDEAGRFVARNLAPGTYALRVESEGWFPQRVQSVEIPTDRDEVVFDVVLVRARGVRGTVLHAQGTPASGARVYLAGGGGILRSIRDTQRYLETYTATDGTWRLDDVPSDRDTWLRASLGPLEAIPTRLRVGEEGPVALTLQQTGKIRGRVVDLATRVGVAGARVEAEPVGPPPVRGKRAVTTNAAGEFEVAGLLPGAWSLLPSKGVDYLPAQPVETSVGSGDSGVAIELRLDPGLVVSGVVTDGTGHPLSGATVRLRGADADGRRVARWNFQTGLRGEFRFTGLTPGTYEVSANRDGHRPASVPDLRGGEDRVSLVLGAAR